MYTLLLLFSLSLTFQGDNGCGIDPNGGCRAATLGDSGPGMDPNGGRAAAKFDQGGGLDPDGASSDAGVIIDPNG